MIVEIHFRFAALNGEQGAKNHRVDSLGQHADRSIRQGRNCRDPGGSRRTGGRGRGTAAHRGRGCVRSPVHPATRARCHGPSPPRKSYARARRPHGSSRGAWEYCSETRRPACRLPRSSRPRCPAQCRRCPDSSSGPGRRPIRAPGPDKERPGVACGPASGELPRSRAWPGRCAPALRHGVTACPPWRPVRPALARRRPGPMRTSSGAHHTAACR